MNPRGSASLVGSGRVSRDFAWLEHAADKIGHTLPSRPPGELWRDSVSQALLTCACH